MTYMTIVADPPWPERGAGQVKRGADRHYDLMSVAAIISMGEWVQSLRSSHGCHLYLWVTNNYLPEGLAVMKAWGFEYKTTITWAKDRIGIGQYFRGQTEHVLFGTFKTPAYRESIAGGRAQGTTLIQTTRQEHSAKPVALLDMAEVVSHPPRIELFTRVKRPGWEAWGNGIATEAML